MRLSRSLNSVSGRRSTIREMVSTCSDLSTQRAEPRHVRYGVIGTARLATSLQGMGVSGIKLHRRAVSGTEVEAARGTPRRFPRLQRSVLRDVADGTATYDH